MKIVVLYGENETGKSGFLKSLKDSERIIIPRMEENHFFNVGRKHLSFLMKELALEHQDLGFENFDSFMSEDSILLFLKEAINKKHETQIIYLETRTELPISLLGRLIGNGLLDPKNVFCLYFEAWKEPTKKTFDKEGFIIYE